METGKKVHEVTEKSDFDSAIDKIKKRIRLININIIFWAVYVIVLPIVFLPVESYLNNSSSIILNLIYWALMVIVLPFTWLYISILISLACNSFSIEEKHQSGERKYQPGGSFLHFLRVACLPLYTFGTLVLLHHDVSNTIIYAFGAVMFLIVLILDLIWKNWSKKVMKTLMEIMEGKETKIVYEG